MKRLIIVLCFVAFMGCATTQNTGPKPTPYFSKEEVSQFYADKMQNQSSTANFLIDMAVFGTTFIFP